VAGGGTGCRIAVHVISGRLLLVFGSCLNGDTIIKRSAEVQYNNNNTGLQYKNFFLLLQLYCTFVDRLKLFVTQGLKNPFLCPDGRVATGEGRLAQ